MTDYTISPAPYAKGKLIARPADSVSGFKGRASFLIEALGGKYVNRSRGYTMSPTAVEKLAALSKAGFTAVLFLKERPEFVHHEKALRGLTLSQALKIARAENMK